MCFVLLVGRSTIVELAFLRKSFPCLVLHQTDKTLKTVIFSSGRLLHPPSTASSTRSNKKGLNDNNNRLLGIVNKFCIPFGTKIKIVICGGLDSAAL